MCKYIYTYRYIYIGPLELLTPRILRVEVNWTLNCCKINKIASYLLTMYVCEFVSAMIKEWLSLVNYVSFDK